VHTEMSFVFTLDNYMQTAKKKFLDSRARRQLTNINTELQDVQRIMVQNIEDVIHRGETLTSKPSKTFFRSKRHAGQIVFAFVAVLDDKAASLSDLSKKYSKDAKYLNLRSSYTKIGLLIILVVAFSFDINSGELSLFPLSATRSLLLGVQLPCHYNL